jgi:RNA polymerase sigma-70 factor (ECF subfamily)
MSSDEKQNTLVLIEQARQHDENACQKLLNVYKGRIFSYILRMVKNYHDAEDLTFDTFIKCFRALDSFDRSRRFSTWLFSIAHNTTIDFFRKNRIQYEYIDERHASNTDFVREFEIKKKMELIDQAITQLAPIDRELVVLFHKEEYSYQEISDIVHLPITTIKTRLHRARKRLRDMVRQMGETFTPEQRIT